MVTNKYNTPFDAQDVIGELKKEYSNLIMYEFETLDINDKCYKQTLKDTGLYTILKENKTIVIAAYKDGSYKGVTQNETIYHRMED